MLLQILGAILQFAGFVYVCLLGGRLSERLLRHSKWLPIAVAGPIILGVIGFLFIFHPVLHFVSFTITVWLIAFAGGIGAVAKDSYTKSDN